MADSEMLGSSQFSRAYDDGMAYFSAVDSLHDDGLLRGKTQQTRSNGFASTATGSTAGHLQRPLPHSNQQPSLPSEDFVSAYVVIDPSQPDRILVPHQLLTYIPPGSTEPLSMSWGPVILPSSVMNKSASSTINQQVPQKQVVTLPASPYQDFPGLFYTELGNTIGDKEVSGSELNDVKIEMTVASAKKRGKVPFSNTPPTRQKNACSKRSRTSDNEDEAATSNGGKPRLLKPLTAYNFYYRDERDNIVLATGDTLPPPVSDFSEAKSQKLLEDRWLKDPTKGRRKHRKTHGKMEFTELSRAIAQRWKDLPPEGRSFYQRLAKADWNRYQENWKQYNQIGNNCSNTTTKEQQQQEEEPSQAMPASIDPLLDVPWEYGDAPSGSSIDFPPEHAGIDEASFDDSAYF